MKLRAVSLVLAAIFFSNITSAQGFGKNYNYDRKLGQGDRFGLKSQSVIETLNQLPATAAGESQLVKTYQSRRYGIARRQTRRVERPMNLDAINQLAPTAAGSADVAVHRYATKPYFLRDRSRSLRD